MTYQSPNFGGAGGFGVSDRVLRYSRRPWEPLASRMSGLPSPSKSEDADVLAAPADEVALRVVVLNLEARLHALDLRGLLVQGFLVAVHHARDDDFLVGEDLGDEAGELIDLAGVGAHQERLAVRHAP